MAQVLHTGNQLNLRTLVNMHFHFKPLYLLNLSTGLGERWALILLSLCLTQKQIIKARASEYRIKLSVAIGLKRDCVMSAFGSPPSLFYFIYLFFYNLFY